MNQPPTLALFDLDHTLLDGDSDVLWCEYLMDRGVLDRAVFEPRNRAIEAGYKAGTVGVLEFCGFYVGTLAGRTPAQWQAQIDVMLAKGAKLSDAEADAVARYLSEDFGAAN